MIREKYVRMYEKSVAMYANVIRVLLKGLFANFSFASYKIAGNFKKVKKTIQISNPVYDIGIKRLYLYYDMKLVFTFGISVERNLIVQFPVFIQPYIEQKQIMYQIEMVPVSIIDHSKQAHSYTHLQVDRLYIALNSETHFFKTLGTWN